MKNSTGSKVLLNAVRLILTLLLNVIFYVLVVAAVVKACSMAHEYAYQVFGDVIVEEPPGTDVEFQINEGESTMSIASRLAHNRLVVNRYTFFIRAMVSTMEDANILPGEYSLNTSMTYSEILDVITDNVLTEDEEG